MSLLDTIRAVLTHHNAYRFPQTGLSLDDISQKFQELVGDITWIRVLGERSTAIQTQTADTIQGNLLRCFELDAMALNVPTEGPSGSLMRKDEDVQVTHQNSTTT